MERDVMDIIRDKEFIELTVAERAELGEMCSSEEEFDQVKSMFAGISAMDWSNPTPKAETKESLDHLFAQKYPKAAPIWYNAPLAVIAPKGKPFYRQPLIQAAAVGLLIFLAYPLVNSSVMDSKTNQVAALDTEMTSSEVKESDKLVKEDVEKSNEIGANEVDESLVETRNQSTPNQQEPFDNIASDVPMSMSKVTTASKDAALSATSVMSIRDSGFDDASFGGVTQPGSTHPDGVFVGDIADVFSAPASNEPAVFDLLTSTF